MALPWASYVALGEARSISVPHLHKRGNLSFLPVFILSASVRGQAAPSPVLFIQRLRSGEHPARSCQAKVRSKWSLQLVVAIIIKITINPASCTGKTRPQLQMLPSANSSSGVFYFLAFSMLARLCPAPAALIYSWRIEIHPFPRPHSGLRFEQDFLICANIS